MNIHTNLYSAKIVRTNLRRRSVVEFLVKLVYRVLFRRNHSSWNKMWPIDTHVAWSVCVYPLVTSMSCAKWLNWSRCCFGLYSWSPRNHVIGWWPLFSPYTVLSGTLNSTPTNQRYSQPCSQGCSSDERSRIWLPVYWSNLLSASYGSDSQHSWSKLVKSHYAIFIHLLSSAALIAKCTVYLSKS